MAETRNKQQNESGCGLLGAILQLGGLKPRKATVAASPTDIKKDNILVKLQSNGSKRRKGSANEMADLDRSIAAKPPIKKVEKPLKKPSFVRRMSMKTRNQNQDRRGKDPKRSSVPPATNSSLNSDSQVVTSNYTRRLRREPTFTSSELSVTINKKLNADGSLYRASTGSVMLVGHLGNLKRQGNKKSLSNLVSSKTVQSGNVSSKFGATGTMGNILKKPLERNHSSGKVSNGLVNKVDPDELKTIGNEKYRQGKFEEALALYSQAIALDSSKASFHSNKSAALMSLGRLIEAVFECMEAIQIEPSYHNAHYRLARLYLRLGEADKAVYHFRYSERKASSKDISEAQALDANLSRCSEARKRRDWNTLLRESQNGISLGADSAPQIYAMQAEALLKLHRHEEAYTVIQKGPNVDSELYTRLLGSSVTANLLAIQSQVYMAVGRFEDAVATAQHAAQLDSSNEVNTIVQRVNTVAEARINGNKLFNASRLPEASLVYSAALELEPRNSVLLCNRAACRSTLRLFEKAVEDCTSALNLRPSYNKARLRRADCNAKLERWEAALQDYEVLMQEVPGDEEVTRGFIEAKKQVEKVHNSDSEKSRTSLKSVSSNERIGPITTAADFYRSSSSSKFLNGIEISRGANCAAVQHGNSLASLKAIPIH